VTAAIIVGTQAHRYRRPPGQARQKGQAAVSSPPLPRPRRAARPLAPVWSVISPELLGMLRVLYGLPDYQVVLEPDGLPPEEWERLMQERPKPGRAGVEV
jgi:hypothetical protein